MKNSPAKNGKKAGKAAIYTSVAMMIAPVLTKWIPDLNEPTAVVVISGALAAAVDFVKYRFLGGKWI